MNTATPPVRSFRPDIAGLRAIAVAAVVLYHFGVPGIRSGFVGVDIFFVISGFLMTGIICKGIDRGTFNVLEFYLARARRIIPALAVLCAVLLLMGWILLIPADYQKLGQRIMSSIGFFSNIQFWQDEPGYFDSRSAENWVLHTWSLSVEWQYYIIFPLVMMALRKLFDARATRWIVVGFTVLSLAISAYASGRWPAAAFYTPPTRAWELLAGGLVFLFPLSPSKSARRVMEVLGVALLAVSMLSFNANTVWPGYLAVLPVLGTMLMLVAANPNSPVTGSRLSQSLGDASYSIYLWHWPVVVYLKYSLITVTLPVLCASIALAVAMGYASYHLVERPTRKMGMTAPRLKALAGYAVTCAAVMLVGVGIAHERGFESRASAAVNLAARESTDMNPQFDTCAIHQDIESPKCMFGDKGAKVSVIVLGDSHAMTTVSAVAEAAGQGRGTLFLGYMGCVTIPDVRLQGVGVRNHCGQFVRNQLDMLKTQYTGVPVVVTNRISQYALGKNEQVEPFTGPPSYFDKPGTFNEAFRQEFTRRYVASMCELTAHHPVYITGPIPEVGRNVPLTFARTLFRKGVAPDLSVPRDQYDQREAFARSVVDAAVKQCGAVALDPAQYLCDAQRCKTVVNGRPLYFDDNHLSEYGNKQLTPMYQKIWQRTYSANP